MEKTGGAEKNGEHSVPELLARLAATDRKLAELRAQSHARVKKFRAKERRK